MAVDCGQAKNIAVALEQPRVIRLAKARRRLDERVEDRLQIERRAADDLEHIGGGGLLLQRFAQLLEQACVLDGDDGLVGEAGDQGDLLIGERANFGTVYDEGSDQLVLLAHWHSDKRPRAAVLRRRARAI